MRRKDVSGSAIFNKPVNGTIHQNLKFKVIKLRDFKMDLIKWQLNFVSCNFGLKSYLWFQIELPLRARSILKSRVWFQIKLHSSQFNYHYELSTRPNYYYLLNQNSRTWLAISSPIWALIGQCIRVMLVIGQYASFCARCCGALCWVNCCVFQHS